MKKSFYIGFLFCFFCNVLHAQNEAFVTGYVSDTVWKPIELANVAIKDLPGGTSTDRRGYFELKVPSNKKVTLLFSCVGYKKDSVIVNLSPNQRKQINVKLVSLTTELSNVEVKDRRIDKIGFTRIDPKTVTFIPTINGGIESLIKTLPGVSSTNELSSQYSVRGGNYDENLVYVNDVEVYRPFLIRSGQQEGLSFVNSDLVSSILFSAGGFDAKYGDKMSSVLDIQYKKPQRFGGSVQMSLLGASAHLEGTAIKNKLSYLIGVRQKSNQYVLKSLETKGDYKPSFTDVQSLISYTLSKKIEFSVLANYARNSYKLVPQTRETDFGTINEALRLKVYFDGQEVDRYETYFGAFTTTFKPKPNVSLKLIASAYKTFESETFDIQGQYWLDQLELDYGTDDFGQVAFNRGVGTYLSHARNNLDATVMNIEQRGFINYENGYFQWGVKAQRELIHDKVSEWYMLDSAGYTLPHPLDSVGYVDPNAQVRYALELMDVVKSKNTLLSGRYSAFVQNTFLFNADNKTALTVGARLSYWDVNKEWLFSPRATFSYRPQWKKDVVLRFSSGVYYQPPFYRELRDMQGKLNKQLKAQQSVHFVAGSDWDFKAWSRPFKFVTEVYYKYLSNLVPYEIDNVRIRYFAQNDAHGYATGIDMRVNGEFVKGAESWVSLSLMKTMEDIENDIYVDDNGDVIKPGYIPRPTDQRFVFNLFFQDYLPKHPTYKMQLNLVYGSGLPFGPPHAEKYQHTLRMPAYRRVDIGFSKQLVGEDVKYSKSNIFRKFNSIWLSVEVFNLLQINNTISYIWIKDITNHEYAIPNYLTPRQLNVKLTAQF